MVTKRIYIKFLDIIDSARIMKIALDFVKGPANVIPSQKIIVIINGTNADAEVEKIKNQGFKIEVLDKK
jgi:hypothetical protein